ncbi:unnamed protein product [Symbiodinium pilosum]|uniref:Uncharacterized protein n=1 Tax=Symbiodinium pilosum TaxID=2952 RepID=A0A812JX20_SYMPI|nr:unnamed protein product [Symbiodinium pilosum]
MSRHPAARAGLLRQLLRCPTGKYDHEEERQHWHTRHLDHIGVCFLSVIYMVMLYALGHGTDPSVPAPPALVFSAQVVVAILALFNLYVELYALPRATKEADDDFLVTYGPLGRWVYLTHQTIGALAVHAIISVMAPSVSGRLACGSYAASPLVGASGVFVTIQYFNLVFSHPDHEKQCQVWAARGVRFGFIDCMRHILPMIVAVFDIMLKHGDTLRATMPSTFGLVCLHFIYVTVFVVAIHFNHCRTGRWPYSFMKDLGVSATRWLTFLAAQGCILSVCGVALARLANLCLW